MNDRIHAIAHEHRRRKAELNKILASIDAVLGKSYNQHLVSAYENVRLALIAEDVDYENKLRVAKGEEKELPNSDPS